MSESANVAITTVLIFLVIVNIVGNSLVCRIIKKHREMRIPINYLIVNLAVADILYAIFIAPRVFYRLPFSHPDGKIGPIFCKFLTDGNLAWLGSASSFVTLVAIAIERYYAIRYPFGNKGRFTRRKLKVIIAVSWIFALLLNIPLFLVRDILKEKKQSGIRCETSWPEKWMGKAYILTWLFMVLLFLALIAALYSKVVYTLWFKSNTDGQLRRQQMGVMRMRKRVTLMVVTVTAIFGICWGTNSVVYVLPFVTSYNTAQALVAIVDTMVLLNSAVNPFVYALLNQQFRDKMKKMICCTGSSAAALQMASQAHNIKLAINTIQPTHTTDPCSTK